MILSGPNDVILDADEHLYVIDSNSKRIIGWGPNGYQCIATCAGQLGIGPDSTNYPFALSFDRYGNIFLIDTGNNRVQKFLIIRNDSGEFYQSTAP